MPTPRLAHAVALAAVLAACGDRAPSPRPAPPAPTTPAAGDRPAEVVQPSPGAAAAGAPSPAAAAVPSGGPSAPAASPAPAAPAAGAPTADAPAGPSGPAGPSAIGATPAASAPAAPAAPAGGAAPSAPAPSPAPIWSVLQAASAVEPGGATIPLARDRDTVVDPGARFEVVLSVASPDARLVLLDPKDALVAGAEAHEVGQSTRLTLAPSAPLAPGRRYTLRVDGATTRELHDGAGKAFTPSTLTVRVAGTAQPEPKQPQATRHKRRH